MYSQQDLACHLIVHAGASALEHHGGDVLAVLWGIGKLLHSLPEACRVHAIVLGSKGHRGLLQGEPATADTEMWRSAAIVRSPGRTCLPLLKLTHTYRNRANVEDDWSQQAHHII